jgi:hypothetical protein
LSLLGTIVYQAEFRSVLLLTEQTLRGPSGSEGMGVKEQLIGVVVVSVVGVAASRTAKWGIAALKAKGVKVPDLG